VKKNVLKWKASLMDLVFGSNSQLCAIAEHYGMSDSQKIFVNDFVSAFAKVMNLDRFDSNKAKPTTTTTTSVG